MKDSGAAKQMQPELRRQVVGRPAPRSRWNNDTPAAAEVQANRLREKQRCQATNGNSPGSVGLRAPGRGHFASPLLRSEERRGGEWGLRPCRSWWARDE